MFRSPNPCAVQSRALILLRPLFFACALRAPSPRKDSGHCIGRYQKLSTRIITTSIIQSTFTKVKSFCSTKRPTAVVTQMETAPRRPAPPPIARLRPHRANLHPTATLPTDCSHELQPGVADLGKTASNLALGQNAVNIKSFGRIDGIRPRSRAETSLSGRPRLTIPARAGLKRVGPWNVIDNVTYRLESAEGLAFSGDFLVGWAGPRFRGAARWGVRCGF